MAKHWHNVVINCWLLLLLVAVLGEVVGLTAFPWGLPCNQQGILLRIKVPTSDLVKSCGPLSGQDLGFSQWDSFPN